MQILLAICTLSALVSGIWLLHLRRKTVKIGELELLAKQYLIVQEIFLTSIFGGCVIIATWWSI